MDREEIVILNAREVPELSGFGRSVEEVFFALDVSELINAGELRSFMIETNVQIRDKSYQYVGVFTRENMDDRGIIPLGSKYVMGPLGEGDVQYRCSFTFINDIEAK